MDNKIILNDVSFEYPSGVRNDKSVLQRVNLAIKSRDIVAIVGKAGSGKTTLLKLMNGLLKPTNGEVEVNGQKVDKKTNNKNLGELRQKVGMIFQFPENQLFGETVLKDVAFGPENFGKNKVLSEKMAKDALEKVQLPKTFFTQSPFDLSGGQMRRVAIAGTLADNPETILLDEPSVGLDSEGKERLVSLLTFLNNQGKTIIFVSHDMELVARLSKRVLVLSNGQIDADLTPADLFSDEKLISKNGLGIPKSVQIYLELKKRGIKLSAVPLTAAQLADEVSQALKGGD